MNANDLVESYVAEVAVELPRKLRNDVAFELRTLLNEELQAKADTTGRAIDADLAIELLRSFGSPAEVAARYRPTLTIIDPRDGYNFLRGTVIGLAIIWCSGLLLRLRQPINSPWDLLGALGQWWGSTVIPSLWWPGVLAVSFGVASWVRRKWPQSSEWKPRTLDRIRGGRAAVVMGLLGILCGLVVILNPPWLLEVFWGGQAAPAAYEALSYTDMFRRRQGPCLLVLLMLNVPLLVSLLVNGRWSPVLRRIELGLSLATCAVIAWTVLDGPIFQAAISDRMAKFLMGLIVVTTLLNVGIKQYRSVRPTPNQPITT